MHNRSKKGDTTVLKIIIVTGLILLVCYILLKITISNGFSPFQATTGNLQGSNKLLACASTSLGGLVRVDDADEDGHPDHCDFCWDGDDGEDPDKDGIPSDCDPAPHTARTNDELENLICKNDLYIISNDEDENKLGCCLNLGVELLDGTKKCVEFRY